LACICGEHQLACGEPQRLGEQPGFRFQESVEFAGNGLGLLRVFVDDGCGMLAAECPAAFPRLAAGARRDMPLAPADTAVLSRTSTMIGPNSVKVR